MKIWSISWNFTPSFINLKIKRVVVNTQCPRCDREEENSCHIFQQCPTSIENQLMYERKHMSGTEIARKIRNYITEIEATKEGKPTLHYSNKIQQVFKKGRATVHFDTAFDSQTFRSTSGLIVWNEEGEILATQAVQHSNIENPFTTEAYAGLQAIKLDRLSEQLSEIFKKGKTVSRS
ncbi:hypothetical protein Goari_026778 [Gossypium aridum]|uniref:Reverse transcriptase zinc-binding domain-containing protein n=1 Tax=Gossypium aridum TaxID=34290 RepID=A0A7J8YQQ6_GOSAI|nr:hypothetical protein [Gossypium aridum]